MHAKPRVLETGAAWKWVSNETASGFERFEFEVTFSALNSAASKMQRVGSHDVFYEELAHYYSGPRRPSVREIADARIEAGSEPTLRKVTLIIRRGHWALGDFFRNAPAPLVYLEKGELVLTAAGEEVRRLPLSSLPL